MEAGGGGGVLTIQRDSLVCSAAGSSAQRRPSVFSHSDAPLEVYWGGGQRSTNRSARKMAQSSELNELNDIKPCPYCSPCSPWTQFRCPYPPPPSGLGFTQKSFKIPGKKNTPLGFLGASGCAVSCCSMPVILVATQLTGLFHCPEAKPSLRCTGVRGSHS